MKLEISVTDYNAHFAMKILLKDLVDKGVDLTTDGIDALAEVSYEIADAMDRASLPSN